MKPRTGILLVAHGSTRDPSANALVQRLAADLRRRGVADEVGVGFHQGEPGFTEALDRLQAARVVVIPLFTSEGYYTQQVVPEALRQGHRYLDIEIRQAPPLGADPAIIELVRRRVLDVATESGLDLSQTSVLVVGHGTARNPQSRDTTLGMASALAGIAAEIRAGFHDDVPDIETAVGALVHVNILVVPFLIGGGSHVTADLPRRLGLDGTSELVRGRRVLIDISLGSYDGLPDLLAEIARRELPPMASAPSFQPGSVALVGAGPGDPGLITVTGLALLRAADVVLHDRLVAPELIAEARRDALIVNVGKLPGSRGTARDEINALLVEHASLGRTVVRLKGGDPFVFGRGAEEVEACQAAGIPCVVVPGITSAIAVPAAAGIPVTARGESRSFAVITAQGEGGELPQALEQLAANPAIETLVLLMGRTVLPELTRVLIAAGRDPDTPAACIQDGTTPKQRVTVATLATLAEAVERDGLTSPVVTVIGAVAARAAGVAGITGIAGITEC